MRPLDRDFAPRRWLSRQWRNIPAPTLFVVSFATLIAIGTLGLVSLPGLQAGEPLGIIDALFTMTSAVCVTGLIVVDTATHFTFAGQLWILLFIQLGGLGLITITTLLIGVLGLRLSLRSEVVAFSGPHSSHGPDMVALVRRAVVYTLSIEAVGMLLLWLLWLPTFGAADAAWHAAFQTVSAFCNAGFSTFSDSLVGFAQQPGLVLVISILVVLGGFGYLSSAEIVRWRRREHHGGARRLSAHTFAALSVTFGLLMAGVVGFALLEWEGVLAPMPVADRLVNAWFMSVTPRTAGFNTVPYDRLSNVSVCFTLFLMIVGGSPGSMAGGVKTTTLAVLGALAIARMRGRRYVVLNRRALPESTVQRTVSLALIAFLLMSVCVIVLSMTETHGRPLAVARETFLPIVFEAVSAFGTVGLSMGITPQLSDPGKLIVILLMFLGRVGPLAFFAAIALRSAARATAVRPAYEDLVVG